MPPRSSVQQRQNLSTLLQPTASYPSYTTDPQAIQQLPRRHEVDSPYTIGYSWSSQRLYPVST